MLAHRKFSGQLTSSRKVKANSSTAATLLLDEKSKHEAELSPAAATAAILTSYNQAAPTATCSNAHAAAVDKQHKETDKPHQKANAVHCLQTAVSQLANRSNTSAASQHFHSLAALSTSHEERI
jgi:uncharacterized protein YydD (DUF2326 family)